MVRSPSGTVTFLLTDVESSTRAWEADAAATAAAIARHEEILGAAITAHAGFRPVEQGEGDSVAARTTVVDHAHDHPPTSLGEQHNKVLIWTFLLS